ncbi:MAG: hypothetical protein JW993_13785 [Sedimentisphaerales bacterium]|nr:hypothetical protein [Sedimentisphaerales bacterium]
MRYAIAIAACAAILVVYCLIASRSSGRRLEELLHMVALVVAIDHTWRRIMTARTIDGPSQREP